MAINSENAIPTREEIFKIFSGTITATQVNIGLEGLAEYLNWQNSNFPFIVLSTDDNPQIFIAFPYDSTHGIYICTYTSSSASNYSIGRYIANRARITRSPFKAAL